MRARMTKPSRRRQRLPDFIAIGPPRTGTTWLHGVLYHRACLPEGVKETRFFDMFYGRGLEWYARYFRGCDHKRPVGEVSPSYFHRPEVRERIAHHLPGCQIICTLREPVARVYSHYRLLHAQGLIRGSFEQEVTTNADLLEANRYGLHLRGWYELLRRDRMAVFFYDDLEADPRAFADAVCRFIGVPPLVLTPEISHFLDRNEVKYGSRSRVLAYNARRLRYWLQGHHAHWVAELLRRAGLWRFCAGRGPEFAALPPHLEARLRERFLPEVEAVEKLTGRDLSAWKPDALGQAGPADARSPAAAAVPAAR